MKRTVGVTLTAEQTSRLIKGESIDINLPPDSEKLILKARANTVDSVMDAIYTSTKKVVKQ